MVKLKKTATIEASPEEVFNYLNKPENWRELYPKISQLWDVKALPNGGYRYNWMFNMAGITTVDVVTENTDVVRNHRLDYRNTCGLKGKRQYTEVNESFTLEPADGATRLSYAADYVVHIPIVGRVLELIFSRMYDIKINVVIANLKKKMKSLR
ncbi:MAG: SRPBCC family protein [Nitrospirae bacterium]|nr:SRPBCC family protein [Nitrospirota bacterium]MBF0592728.1 SRPBCC family protein [Nitrospirota bacterium]